MKAIVRDDLVEEDLAPPILLNGKESYLPFDLCALSFDCMQPDRLGGEFWNTILYHPAIGCFMANSIDLEFIPEATQ